MWLPQNNSSTAKHNLLYLHQVNFTKDNKPVGRKILCLPNHINRTTERNKTPQKT